MNGLDVALKMQGARGVHEGKKGPSHENCLNCRFVERKEGESIGAVSNNKNNVADVYDIPAIAALELLAFNIESLGKVVGPPDAQYTDDVSNGQVVPMKMAGLHAPPEVSDAGTRDLVQLSVLSKRFVSKKEPPISLRDYLLRLHKYCPMSTAVYLATCLYFTRMVVVERLLFVTPKNRHRLVLAGLQVAMKALEDLSYPHSRVAKVGGVSERELFKVEISFCFLVDFKLRVDAQMLLDEANALIQRCMSCEDVVK